MAPASRMASADAPMLDALYEQASRALDQADRSTYSIERGDVETADRQAARAASNLATVNQALLAYGLSECAK